MYGLPARRLRFIHNDHTPRTDVIVAERAGRGVPGIWRALRTDRETAGTFCSSASSNATRRTQQVVREYAAADGCATGTWRSSDSPYLTLTGTWDELSRYAVGEVPIEPSEPAVAPDQARRAGASKCSPTGDPSSRARDDAWRLEASGWKREAGTAITSDPAVQRFYTSLIERGTQAGWLQLLFLTVGDRRIATSYGACFDNRLFLFKTGYDPEFATCSPFKVLTSFAIQEAYARRPDRGRLPGRRRALEARMDGGEPRHTTGCTSSPTPCEPGFCILSSSSGCRS